MTIWFYPCYGVSKLHQLSNHCQWPRRVAGRDLQSTPHEIQPEAGWMFCCGSCIIPMCVSSSPLPKIGNVGGFNSMCFSPVRWPCIAPVSNAHLHVDKGAKLSMLMFTVFTSGRSPRRSLKRCGSGTWTTRVSCTKSSKKINGSSCLVFNRKGSSLEWDLKKCEEVIWGGRRYWGEMTREEGI